MVSFAAEKLKGIIERIERLEEDKRSVRDDIKEVYAEAKSDGFDVKILRKVVALRRKDRHEREEEDAVLGLYMKTLGEGTLGDDA